MFGFGMQELVIISIVLLLVFGAAKLPEAGRGIGLAIRNFRKATVEPGEIEEAQHKKAPLEKKPVDGEPRNEVT
jgi:sec-independent protein translocase protein TatA